MALRMGAEDKKKVAIAGALGIVVLFLGGRMLMDNFSTPTVGHATAGSSNSAATGKQCRASCGEGRLRQP